MKLILSFDAHKYFLVPHLCASEYVELARQLLALTPTDGPIELDEAAEELRFRANRAEIRIAALADEYDHAAEQCEVEMESWTDTVASMVHSSFDDWSIFVMPGGPEVGDDPVALAKQSKEHERAARARLIHESLFGEDILDFLRLSYRERFTTLSAVLRSLVADDLGQNAGELLTPALCDGRLATLAEQYEERVAKHLRERDESRSLGNHRVALRWAIAAYAHPVGEMADRWSKESCDRANALIMPLHDACVAETQRRRKKFDEAIAAKREREAKGDEQE